MTKPIKAWAIKTPTDKIDPGTVECSEGGAWRRACLLWSRVAGPIIDNDRRIKFLFEDGYRAVRVEIREVEE